MEPHVAMGHGLALAGRMSIRAEGFRRGIDSLLSGCQVEAVVKNRLPMLADKVGEAAADGVTKRQVIPAFRHWRQGEIRTLNDVATTIAVGVNEELVDPQNRRLDKAIAGWWDSLRPKLAELTRPICEEWHVLPSAMELPPISLGRQEWWLSNAVTDPFETLVKSVAGVVTNVVAMSSFGAIATTGPFALVTAVVVGFSVLMVGKDAAKEKAMGANMPLGLRQLSNEQKLVAKLQREAKTAEAELAQEIAKQFQTDNGDQVVRAITQLINKELHKLAEDAEP